MRTTVRLDEALLNEARRFAVQRGTTLTAVFEAALREMLARRMQASAAPLRVPLPTFRGRGPRAGIDLHDSAAVLEAMEVAEDAGA